MYKHYTLLSLVDLCIHLYIYLHHYDHSTKETASKVVYVPDINILIRNLKSQSKVIFQWKEDLYLPPERFVILLLSSLISCCRSSTVLLYWFLASSSWNIKRKINHKYFIVTGMPYKRLGSDSNSRMTSSNTMLNVYGSILTDQPWSLFQSTHTILLIIIYI